MKIMAGIFVKQVISETDRDFMRWSSCLNGRRGYRGLTPRRPLSDPSLQALFEIVLVSVNRPVAVVIDKIAAVAMGGRFIRIDGLIFLHKFHCE